MTARVVNRYKEPFDVFIGRGSVWGNPYSHKEGTKAQFQVATRDESVDQHSAYLWDQIRRGVITTEMLLALDGCTLGCYCKPQRCHGDNIIEAIEWVKRYG